MDVGQVALNHIIQVAKACGYARLIFETESGEALKPALTLYIRNDFEKETIRQVV
jgi:hypothetical protein